MQYLQIIIQARMTSSRLPGKVMLPLMGKPVLEVMLERLQNFKDSIIIATTDDGTEQPIVELCHKLEVKYFNGSTENVLSRYYNAAVNYKANSRTKILRLTSDCPLIDETLVRKVVDNLDCSHIDMVSVGPHSGFPRGLDCCGFRFKTLETTHKLATNIADREHVTLGMPKYSNLTTLNLAAEEDLSHFRLTLDEPDDYLAIKAVYQALGNSTDFSLDELIRILKNNPNLYEINKNVQQKNA
ncbi:cytidylyltransferase domain-containing protein [Pseudoalteromonas xiamenensis]